MQIEWEYAPEWAHVVVEAYGYYYYLEHNHKGRATYVRRVGNRGSGVMTSADNHGWWDFDVVAVRPLELVDECVVERNIFISQAYALYKSTSPKYDVFGAMFDAGCRFPEEV